MRSFAAVLALLVVTAPALAGSPEEPEVTDESGDAALPLGNQYADVTAGWIEDLGDGTLRFGIEVAEITEIPPFTAYAWTFEVDGKAKYAALVNSFGIDFLYGNWDATAPGPTSSKDASGGSLTLGAPATITVDVKASKLGRNATALTKHIVLAVDFKQQFVASGVTVLDEGTGDGVFDLAAAPVTVANESAPAEDAAEPNAVPGVAAPLALGVVAAAAVAARRRG